MSKQRKTPEQAPVGSRSEGSRAKEAESGREGPGNAAVQDQISGRAADGAVGLDVVRETAAPMLDRAALALQLFPRERTQVERFAGILEKSNLPDDRKAALIERLRSDEAAANGVAEVVARHFGADGDEVRGAIVDGLDTLGRSLADGGPGSEHSSWQVGDREIALSAAALEGAVSTRAEALLSDLADSLLAGLAATRSPGEAVVGLCRDLNLALLWDEEEEEEGLDVAAPEEI